jgi:enoyl-CoA hydratase/carnithine racemase
MEREPVNAIHPPMADELFSAYGQAKEDDAVHAIILTSGVERAFSAGLDFEVSRGMSGAEHREFQQQFYLQQHALHHRLGKPTIAAVTGPAMAGGVTLAVNCNCIVVNEEAEWGYPEINIGFIPGFHFIHLPQQIGRHRAFELLFSGESITGTEAEDIGLVNRAVPPDDVVSEARELASSFAEKAPRIMELAHNSYMQIVDEGYRRGLGNVIDLSSYITDFEESQEGRDAFVEDRDPSW